MIWHDLTTTWDRGSQALARSWIRTFGIPTAPAWWCQWLKQQLVAYNQRVVVPQLMTAEQATAREHWLPGDTAPQQVLAWIDLQVHDLPAALVPDLDLIQVGVAACSATDWQQAHTQDLDLPPAALHTTWYGTRQTWATSGRAHVAAALPLQHTGLYLCVTGAGAAWTALAATTT